MRKWFILFIIAVFPLIAFADAVQIGSLWYILDESSKTAEVTKSGGDGYTGDIVIPSTVSYNSETYYVKTIGEGAFYDISLHSVTIEDGVETIANQAFWDSDGIYELKLPSTLKTIGDEAFTWVFITNLELPEGLESIGQGAFRNSHYIRKITFPSTLTSIGNNAFESCNSLSMIVSHIQTPYEISWDVFSSGYSATLYVPEGKTSVYQETSGWNNFSEIVEGEPLDVTVDGLIYLYNTTTKDASAIGRSNSDMRSITIPSTVSINGVKYNVTSIGKDAFSSNGIDSLIISSGVETIGQSAFSSCTSLRCVTPSTPTGSTAATTRLWIPSTSFSLIPISLF